VERAARTERLTNLVAQARQVQTLAHPTTAYLLRVLDALTPDDIEELSLWQLRNERAEGIVDRITAELGEHRQAVRGVLSDCLRLDVWGDYDRHYAAVRDRYEASGEADAAIERRIGRPPRTYSFLLHGCVDQWRPEQEDFSTLIIEDDTWGAICDGYLVAKGRAFSTKLALMEASVREGWQRWHILWRWF
jgi:hypothetical protein